ncbi:hypothetical protein VR611_02110 [Aquirufa nivalisilvae]
MILGDINTFNEGISASIIASFAVLSFQLIWNLIIKKYYKYRFKNLFGYYENKNLKLVIPELTLRQEVKQLIYKAKKIQNNEYPFKNNSDKHVSSSKLFPYADTKALNYTLSVVAKYIKGNNYTITNDSIKDNLDFSLIAFGGINFYCQYFLSDPDNRFLKIGDNEIIALDNNNTYKIDSDYDYGFIIKTKIKNLPDNTWILIAGLAESGTSGAGWFLSKNWKELSKSFNDKSFAIIVKVRHGSDSSATEVHRISSD